jgi:NAD(P)-dependent dehydrogenase (short-subunit alcohol dehydrogenase family)
MSHHQSASHQIVLVTGTNSGFGRLIVQTIARKGHTVFATMRDIAGRNAAAAAEYRSLAAAEGLHIHPIEVDLLSDASVEAAVEEAARTAGPISVLVNNAGMGIIGLEETLTPEQLEEQLRVNVVVPHRLARAVLPSMRSQGRGLLIHVSSSLGRVVFPLMGAYSASKAALEALFDAYRYELAALGIESTIVQPGAYATDFGKNVRIGAEAERGQGYGPLADGLKQISTNLERMTSGPNAPNPQDVADAVLGLIEAVPGTRPDRVTVDPATGDAIRSLNAAHFQIQDAFLKAMMGGGGSSA